MENLFRVDDIKVDMPSKVLSDNVAKIAVIGVGGGGCGVKSLDGGGDFDGRSPGLDFDLDLTGSG